MVTMASRARRTPVKVGFYEIQRTIGKGNFAEVKLAKHTITKTEVAIKIIDKRSLDQTNLKKIYREIQILKLLNHQHIIKLYQVMQTKTTIYLVCEYARNGELFDYITQKGKLPEEKAQKMFWQVLTAVEYCHKNNVVHRDLKAENMLLDGNDNIKLADFGFGNFYQSGQNLSTWCGSPPYAAPEVFDGKLYEGPQLDVWSLGVVLYVLVCGTFPFDGSNLSTLKERVLSGRFRIPYWMSQDCENLVRKMLVLNPKKRLTIAQIKKHKWLEPVRPTWGSLTSLNDASRSQRRKKPSEYNEHVLKIMQGYEIDIAKTKQSLSVSAYDHLYAIYHLLADRLKLHRTSFPLESRCSTERRRPSNIADQVILSVPQYTTAFEHQSSNPLIALNKSALHDSNDRNNFGAMDLSDISFEDVTTGLPTVNRTMVDSPPPLPLIKTSLYTDDENVEINNYRIAANQNMLQIPNSGVPTVCQQNAVFPQHGYCHNNGMANDRLPLNSEEVLGKTVVNMGGYNLQQRRHTLMVPSLAQLNTEQLQQRCNSGENIYQNQLPVGLPQFLNNPSNVMDSAYRSKDSPQPFEQSSHTSPINPPGLLHNHSMVDTIAKNMNEQSTEPMEPNLIHNIKQRDRNLSPIGFREGRRASDGLLLLGDHSLKLRLQKLARVKGVPEIAQDKTGAECATSVTAAPSVISGNNDENFLSLPVSTELTGSNGDSINFQPYSNQQSLSRRRSLQVQHMQIRRSSVTAIPVPTVDVSGQNSANFSENISGSHPHVPAQTVDMDHIRQWSSWKQVQGLNSGAENQGNATINLNCDLTKTNFSSGLSVASDDSVPSKASVAAQMQRDSLHKPVRQQSLPLSTIPKGAYPFSPAYVNHPQSLVQQLQQRRFERKLKVASHQQALAYPLPELEHLKICGEETLKLPQNTISNMSSNNTSLLGIFNNQQAKFDSFSQENTVHGMRCLVNDENINYGADESHFSSPDLELHKHNNLLLSGDEQAKFNESFFLIGNTTNSVVSWVRETQNLNAKNVEAMEFAMY